MSNSGLIFGLYDLNKTGIARFSVQVDFDIFGNEDDAWSWAASIFDQCSVEATKITEYENRSLHLSYLKSIREQILEQAEANTGFLTIQRKNLLGHLSVYIEELEEESALKPKRSLFSWLRR